MHTYNTNNKPLILKEYGRNVQQMVTHLSQIADKVTRTKQAEAILKVMDIVNSNTTSLASNKLPIDYSQKRWDDLYIMAKHNLNINSPLPMPKADLLIERPPRLPYPKKKLLYRHLGKHMEEYVKKLMTQQQFTLKKEEIITSLIKFIKNFSSHWNKDNLDNVAALAIIENFINEKLNIDPEKIKIEKNVQEQNTHIKKEESRKEEQKQQRQHKKINTGGKKRQNIKNNNNLNVTA